MTRRSSKEFTWLGRTFKVVPLHLIDIDPSYQRELVKKAVRRMTDDFDEDGLRCVVLAEKPNGRYACIDGNHRVTVMKARGYKEVAAEIRHNYTVQRQAKVFPLLNNMSTVKPSAKFRAALKAGCETEVRIAKIVGSQNFSIQLEAGRPPKGSNVITAVGALQGIVREFSFETLENALHVISEVFSLHGQVQRSAMKDMFIHGVARYLFNSKDDPATVIELLRGKDATDLYKYAEMGHSYRKDISKKLAAWITKQRRQVAAARRTNVPVKPQRQQRKKAA